MKREIFCAGCGLQSFAPTKGNNVLNRVRAIKDILSTVMGVLTALGIEATATDDPRVAVAIGIVGALVTFIYTFKGGGNHDDLPSAVGYRRIYETDDEF